jgi:hypothetical protein
MSSVDDLERAIQASLSDVVRDCEPSPRVWERIVEQVKLDKAASETMPARVDQRDPVDAGMHLAPLCRQRVDSSGAWDYGLLSFLIQWEPPKKHPAR